MIQKEPLKGDKIDIVAVLIGKNKRIKPVLHIIDNQGQRYYLSWENLQKILGGLDFDVDQKRIRKHLIPMIKNETLEQNS